MDSDDASLYEWAAAMEELFNSDDDVDERMVRELDFVEQQGLFG